MSDQTTRVLTELESEWESRAKAALDGLWHDEARDALRRKAALTDALARLARLDALRAQVEASVFVYQQPGDGKCFGACISTLTGIPFEAWSALIPDMPAPDFWDAIYAVVHAHGWELARTGAAPIGYAIADGDGPRRGVRHSIVVHDGVLVHDPHPDGGGLTSTPICYWIPVRLALLPGTETTADAYINWPSREALPLLRDAAALIERDALRELAERLVPKCPGCGSRADRPKCLFEGGSECPRHAIMQIFDNGRRYERAVRERPAQCARKGRRLSCTTQAGSGAG